MAVLEGILSDLGAAERNGRHMKTQTIAPVFVDTCVFLGARDASDPIRRRTATEWLEYLWEERLGRTSAQVLNDYYLGATRRSQPASTRDDVWEDIQALFAWKPWPTDMTLLIRARDLEQRHRLCWPSSLAVAAAQLQGCVVLLTDELVPGATYGEVTIHNPFVFGVAEPLPPYVVSCSPAPAA